MRPIHTLSLLAILMFAGCQDKKNDFLSDSLKEVVAPQQTQTTRQTRNHTNGMNSKSPQQTINPINAPIVPPIGIKVDQNQIIIDTTQTKKFLESITKKIDQSFKEATQDLKNNRVKSTNEAGIIITQNRIVVDLNKTQKFMEKWIDSMEAVGKQLDNIAKELDKSFNP